MGTGASAERGFEHGISDVAGHELGHGGVGGVAAHAPGSRRAEMDAFGHGAGDAVGGEGAHLASGEGVHLASGEGAHLAEEEGIRGFAGRFKQWVGGEMKSGMKSAFKSALKLFLPILVVLGLLGYEFYQTEQECKCSCNYTEGGDGVCGQEVQSDISTKCPNGCNPQMCIDLSNEENGSGMVIAPFFIIGLLLGMLGGVFAGSIGLSIFFMVLGSAGGALLGWGKGGILINKFVDAVDIINTECQDASDTESCCQEKCGAPQTERLADIFMECVGNLGMVLGIIIFGLVILLVLSYFISFVKYISSQNIASPNIASPNIASQNIASQNMVGGGPNIASPNMVGGGSIGVGIGLVTVVVGSILLIMMVVSPGGNLGGIFYTFVDDNGMTLLRDLYDDTISEGASQTDSQTDDTSNNCNWHPPPTGSQHDPVTPELCNQHKCRYNGGTVDAPLANPICQDCSVIYDEECSLCPWKEPMEHMVGVIMAWRFLKTKNPVFVRMRRHLFKYVGKISLGIVKIVAKILTKIAIKISTKLELKAAEMGGLEAASAALVAGSAGILLPIVLAVDAASWGLMALDVADPEAFRSYVSNESFILPKRNSIDGLFIKGVFGVSDENDEIPPNQSPYIFQLNLLTDTFKDNLTDEGQAFKMISEAYTEAQMKWPMKVADLIHGGGASTHLLDLFNIYSDLHDSTESTNWCVHEIELETAFDNMVNYDPQIRDVHCYEYIKTYMERGAINAPEHIAGQTETSDTENIWDKVLSPNSELIISSGIEHGQVPVGHPAPGSQPRWKYSDLIKNYGIGTNKISGVSLTEAGCVLLNQVLHWDSYLWNTDINPVIGAIPPADLSQIRTVKKKPRDQPKVTFINTYRELKSITKDDEDDDIYVLETKYTANREYLPQFYPSAGVLETLCLLGYEGLKLMTDDTSLTTEVGLDFMARGDGVNQDSQEAWAPFLYGVSYDDVTGLCKYNETPPANAYTPLYSGLPENYCTRMGVSDLVPKFETPGGRTYMNCDDDPGIVGDTFDLFVSSEVRHEVNRSISDIENEAEALWDDMFR